MKIAVIGGTGYVGLTTAVCLAVKGHLVFCVGRNRKKTKKLSNGVPPIYENHLENLLREVLAKRKFVATTSVKIAVEKSDMSFICVGTPSNRDGRINLTQVEAAAREIGHALAKKNGYHVVVVKSTVVPGTTEKMVKSVLERVSGKRAGVDFGVCMNPEFLREGRAVRDFLFPKDVGIVIGELDNRSGDVLTKIYEDFDAEILRTDLTTAELIKYARNSYLAKDISFANELANICQVCRVDYLSVKKGMEMDVRIGKERFLNAGAGFGGSCFRKDVEAFVKKAREAGIEPRMLEATLRVNNDQPLKLVELLQNLVGKLEGTRIAVLGLAFKPGTDDMRDAPSIRIVETLLNDGAHVCVYDPKALENARRIFGETVIYADSIEEALGNADACLIVTEWSEFADSGLYNHMRGKIIIDGRRALDPRNLAHGFLYHAIGFPEAVKT